MSTLETPPPDPSAASPRYLARASRALLVLATVTVGALLYFGHEVFKPVALALLFALVLSNAVEGLHRFGLPRAVSAFLMLLILITGIGAATDALIEPAQKWLASAPSTLQVVERKIRPVERWMHRLEGLTHRAGEMGGSHGMTPGPGGPPPAAAPLSGSEVLSATGATLADIVTIVILTLFLLSGGPPMLARMAASLGSDLQAVHALRAIDAIRIELGRYYGTITLINIGLGAATAVAMLLLGVPNPYLWGAVAAVLNFIPYVGSATTLLLLAVVALVSFDDLGHVFGVAGSYLALATVEGQVLQPLLVGRRLDLNPILVFLAVWFGGWFWGVAGIVIAVPTLVALKVAATHSEHAGAIVAFLSPSGSKTLQSLQGRVTEVRARLRPASTSNAPEA
jgi:predicted PurR-regulated permease PerM